MPVSKRAKFRGSRTCGGGTLKNRRGAGNRGGRGHSGGCKHHFVKYYMNEGRVFGKNGFKTAKDTVNAIDIGCLELMIPSLISTGEAKEEGGVVHIDVSLLGYDKVLGGGRVTRKLNLSAPSFSERAKEKIEAVGGQAVSI